MANGKTKKVRKNMEKKCEECGSIYEITNQRFPIRDSDYFNCEVCGHEMDRWNSTTCPNYRLIYREKTEES